MATKFPPIGLSAVIDNMDGFTRASVQINQAYDKMDSGADKVSKSSMSLSGVLTGLGTVLSTTIVAAAAAAAAAIAGMVAGLVALAAQSVKVGAAYTKEMSNVKALTGATAQEFAQLEASAEHLGATTAFTAQQAAEGMGFLAMAGFETNEIISSMPGVLNLAAAGNLDLATSADIVSNVLTGMGASVDETDKFVDVLTATMTSSNTSLIQLGEGMKFIAPIAGSMGLEVESVAAAMGTLGDAGIQSTMAGTALRSMLLSLSAPTSGAAKKMEELGFSAFRADGTIKDLPEVIGDLSGALEGMNDQARVETLNSIFGKRNVAAVSILLEKGQEDLQAFGDELRNSTGRAAEIAGTQLDNLSGDVTLLGSAFDGLKIEIFKQLDPLLRNIVQFAGAMLERIAPHLTNLYSFLAGAGQSAFGAITNVINVFFNNLDKGLGFMNSLRMALFEMIPSVLLQNVYAVIDGFSDLWEAVKTLAIDLFPSMKQAGEDVGNVFLNVLNGALGFVADVILPKLVEGINFVRENWRDWAKIIKDSVKTVIEFGKNAIQFVIDNWPAFVEGFNKAIEIGREFWLIIKKHIIPFVKKLVKLFSKDVPKGQKKMQDAWKKVRKQLDPLIKKILPDLLEIFEIIKQWTIKNWPLIQETITTVIKFIRKVIVTNLKNIQKFWNDWGDTIIAIMETTWDALVIIVKVQIKAILKAIEIGMKIITGDWEGAWEEIKRITTKLWGGIKVAVSTALNAISDIIANVLSEAANTVTKKFTEMKNSVSQKMTDIKNSISQKWEEIKNLASQKAQEMIERIKQAFSAGVGGVTTAFRNMLVNAINAISAFAGDLGSALWNIGVNMMSRIRDAITSAWTRIRDGVSTAIQSGVSAASSLASSVISTIRAIGTAIMTQMQAAIIQVWTRVRDGVTTAITVGLSSISTFFTKAYDIGRGIINSIITGINSLKSTLRSILEGVADAIPDWIRDWLGMNSPSVVMMKVGNDIGAGLAMGIAQSIPLVQSATAGIAQAPPTVASTVAGATNTTNVSNTFNVGGNTISNDMDAAVFEARVLQTIRNNL